MLLTFTKAIAQSDLKQSEATPATTKINESIYSQLNFADTLDIADAHRGFIATIADGIIKDENGRPIVNTKLFDFIKGKSPATVNPSLWRQAKIGNINGLFKVADGIYQVRGLDLANIAFIESNTGYIVVDPLTNAVASSVAYDLIKKYVKDKPVVAVISTHSHSDHFGGIEGVVSAADIASGKVKYITPAHFFDEAVSEHVLLGNVMGRRAGYQFGSSLPISEKGQVDAGIGKAYLGTGAKSTILKPTDEISSTGQTLVIDGIELVFQITPDTEAPSAFTFYVPSKKAYFPADITLRTFHNILTPRGAKARDAKGWSKYIDESIDLFGKNVEVIIPGHNWPVFGQEKSISFLEKQRDAYKYLHDQTIRLANKGLNADEIAEEIKFPEELSKEWYLREYYGTVAHNAKAIYQYYLGWWDGNPADYNKLPQTESAKRYVEWFGGEKEALKKAKIAYGKGEYRWVAEVLKHVVFANPKNQEARDLQASAFEQIAYQSESGIWRNIYLTGAKELRQDISNAPLANQAQKEKWERALNRLSPENIFDLLAVSVDGKKAEGKKLTLRFNFTDKGKNILVYLKNGVLNYSLARPEVVTEFSISLPQEKFAELFSRPENAIAIFQSPDVKFEGNPVKLKELAQYLDLASTNWNIVTP
ncbi:alkyl sulfatase BDS1-like metallo-beta-lactamase superfamily hydrolase [Sphingobacterium siyangense]|uniref:Alkyl sulfatase BDS1-like metallo-beta-lactamase superfamily hydrolase n=2 Tax=Sphingobacterium siyangense TaxID=459529 RepID=A0A562MKC7_9SPHI|nr:alkyl sulfatase BDS1-like metallo-beta-lactamase superfamily hydrolase [Sphingobacterium siyangense]